MTASAGRIAAAEALWQSGALTQALALAEQISAEESGPGDPRLLRIRVECLRRLRRTAEALEVAERAQVGTDSDEYLSRALTYGMVLSTLGRWEHSDGVLADAERHASSVDDREDIAVFRGFNAVNRHRYEEARAILGSVRPRNSIAYARRLEHEALIAFMTCDFTGASDTMERALERLSTVPHDRHLELRMLSFLGNLACESLDIPRWLAISERYAAMEPISPELWYPSFVLNRQRSCIMEMLGDPDAALRSADRALSNPLPTSLRLYGLCRKALVFARYGEHYAFHDTARAIRRLYAEARLEPAQHPLEMSAFFSIAEVLAHERDAEGAERIVRDWETHPRVDTPWRDHPVERYLREYVFGLISDARGDTLRARRWYTRAMRGLRSIGFHRGGVIAALRLLDLSRDRDVARYIDEHVHRLGPQSWLRRRIAEFVSASEEPIWATLTRTERSVLQMLLQGSSTAEIAAQHKRSEKTIRNTVSALLKAFAVENRQALLAECLRRGVSPDAAATR